jgi:hypothetical protein
MTMALKSKIKTNRQAAWVAGAIVIAVVVILAVIAAASALVWS